LLLLSRGSVVIVIGRRGVASHSDARFEQLAIVGLIFTGYPYWYRF
jgi:ribose 1,5-bisphosphokinase PhnN